jgi:hypothetical protein
VDYADPQFIGSYWIAGQGNNALGVGMDSGLNTGTAADNNLNFLNNLGIPGSRCLDIDFGNAGADGCPTLGGTLWIVVSDGLNRAFSASHAGTAVAGGFEYSMGEITNGGAAPTFGGVGLLTGRAVHVSQADLVGGKASVDVAALAVPNYSETGGRPLPGTVQLRGTNNASPTTAAGAGAHNDFLVDTDTDLCWEIVDGSFTAVLGCVRVGGNTPSQNVQNAKATIGRGELKFSWDVSAQFDVLGFNVIQKNVTKGTERKVNDALIPISGMNDAQAASYSFDAGRKDLQAVRGGFEIELVRLNGETSRTPAPLSK